MAKTAKSVDFFGVPDQTKFYANNPMSGHQIQTT